MLLIQTLFKKFNEVLFGTVETKRSSKKRTRTLRIEELEPREMLSATPVDWDWNEWWGNFESSTVQLDPLPSGYNIDANSEDFGQISLGGNNSQIDPTAALMPDVISNLAAYNTATRQENTTIQNENSSPISGTNTETMTVGIVSQDLGNGDWTYTEATAYTYSFTSDENLSWGGYSYYISSSFIEGIYNSTFSLTTEYGGTTSFTSDSESDDSTLCWEIMSEYNVTETVLITQFHNTLTSERNSADTRTTQGNSSYRESGSFSSDGFGYSMHANSWSNTLVNSNVAYQWAEEAWQITGAATTTDGFGYDWGTTLSVTHDTGTIYINESSSHNESATVLWNYNDVAATWIAASVTGEGGGMSSYIYQGDASITYERPFYESLITGTEEASIDQQRDETWDVSFSIVEGQVVRATEGSYTETYDAVSSFSGSGSHNTSRTTTTSGSTASYRQIYDEGASVFHLGVEANHSESGSQTYSETITGEWSSTGDGDWQESADAVIVTTTSGAYDYSFSQSSSLDVYGSFSDSDSYFSSDGTYDWHSDSIQSHGGSEQYETEVTENWHSDGGEFALVSLVGTASGGGVCTSRQDHKNNWKEKGSSEYISEYDDGSSYSSSFTESSDNFSDILSTESYDYTAHWGWNTNSGGSLSVVNQVLSTSVLKVKYSSEYEWAEDYGDGYSYNGDESSNNPFSSITTYYDETISYTGWKDGQSRAPTDTRWSPFSLSEEDYNDSDDGSGGGNCFTAGTQIVVGAAFTEDDVFEQYVTVNIEDIKVGDLVYSYDTLTGEVTQKEVTDAFVRETDHLNYLTVVDAEGNEQVIETTDSHPFWVVTDEPDIDRVARELVDENGVLLYHEGVTPTENGFWVEAKDLQEGDVFIGANGELSTLMSKERVEFDENILVYNFTVAGNHDYFVLAEEGEQTSILVHNAQCGDEELDKNIDDLTKKRLQGLANGGKKAEIALNTANSINPVGSIAAAVLNEDATGKPLTRSERFFSFLGGIPNKVTQRISAAYTAIGVAVGLLDPPQK